MLKKKYKELVNQSLMYIDSDFKGIIEDESLKDGTVVEGNTNHVKKFK